MEPDEEVNDQGEELSAQTLFDLSDKTYNRLKYLVLIVIPAISGFYFSLAAIWDLPAADKVSGTLAIVAVLLGALVGISSVRYSSAAPPTVGDIVATVNSGKILYSLEFDSDGMLNTIRHNERVVFNVREE